METTATLARPTLHGGTDLMEFLAAWARHRYGPLAQVTDVVRLSGHAAVTAGFTGSWPRAGSNADVFDSASVELAVHGDYYSHNWLVAGSVLAAVVDWETSGVGPQVHKNALAKVEIRRHAAAPQ